MVNLEIFGRNIYVVQLFPMFIVCDRMYNIYRDYNSNFANSDGCD